ncbi:alpha-mannosidase [Paenibacillus hamazuiensis]|uniref:alpha-mannosidase n=1 Tax=Paenibacillus hamazuiensis TaxID=2936508 RepID=UPI00201077D0|nr:alpha-mannosidase [Paenibacillus hamazuiensis]
MYFFTEEKLALRIRELAGYRYRDAVKIEAFRFQLDEKGEIGAYPPEGGTWVEMRVGDRWTGHDVYAWLTADVPIPVEWKGRPIVGLFDFSAPGAGTGGGTAFESLLYVNGSPYHGVDANHQEVFLPEDAAGTALSLKFRTWSGMGGGPGKPRECELKRAEVAWLDEAADDLYYTGWAIVETVKEMDGGSAERHALLQALNQAMNLVDWSYPGSSAFYESVFEARAALRAELGKMEKHHPVTLHCVGHTHIDVAWLWQLKHTREKAARSFSTVLRLMEKYPEYMFLQSQPQLYDYIKKDYPEIYEQIRARVKEGRWEASGGMWLEADCNVPSGESLVRQILLGTRFLKEEFGVECTYLWLPDVFGYSWALPQILKKSGIPTFMTTKISWNQYNQMPHDTFIWKGIDGSEVLAHFITTPRPGQKDVKRHGYNGVLRAETALGLWDRYRDKGLNKELLMSYGYGDGGGGANREMLEHRRRLDELPGMPRMVISRADRFFEKLQRTVAETKEYVHTWDGELYLEYHRGTLTSQAYNKLMNRKLELLYREAEFLCTLDCLLGAGWSSYPQRKLEEGWKIVLRNQFHDIIPGSSIKEVYEDSRKEYEEAESIGAGVWKAAAEAIASGGPGSQAVAGGTAETLTVFNSANWRRKDLLKVPLTQGREEGVWVGGNGHELPAQRSSGFWLVETPELPSMGCGEIRFRPAAASAQSGQAQAVPFTAHATGLSTPHYVMEWNVHGHLTRVFDKSAGREVLAQGACGNVLQVFEDKPLMHDAWDIDLFYQEKMRVIDGIRRVEVKELGPLRAVVQFEWTFGKSAIFQNMVLYAESRRIDFETKVVWRERQQLLKVAFPVEVRATEATYDIQFGNVRRPTHWNTSWDLAKFETAGHQWADLSEHGYGVSLLNDCKYGYDIKGNTMRLTLIKSAIRPDPTQDQGEHAFTYALLPHAGGWLEGNTVREAWQLNNPLTCTAGKPALAKLCLFGTDNEHVLIDAVKKAEDGDRVVLRLHEFAGGRGMVEIASGLPIRSWQECDLLERPVGERHTVPTLRFPIAPYEIKTFLIEMG